jgi:hypothetical protein
VLGCRVHGIRDIGGGVKGYVKGRTYLSLRDSRNNHSHTSDPQCRIKD